MSGGATTDSPPRGIALMFSGGLDSSYETVRCLEEYREVYLLSFDNGCSFNMRGPQGRADELRSLFGHERVHYLAVNTGPLIKRLGGDFRDLRRRYQTHLVFDLVCQLASTIELICLARSRGTPHVTDGASRAQTELFMQDPEFHAHKEPFFEAHGVSYRRPHGYDLGRVEKQAALHEAGLSAGPRLLEKTYEYHHVSSARKHQPFCMRVFLNHPWIDDRTRHREIVKKHGLPVPKAKKLWDELLPRADDYLAERLGA